jgi:tetratricopeptide (TPR) repeat protein
MTDEIISENASPPDDGPPPGQTGDNGTKKSPPSNEDQPLGHYIQLGLSLFGSLAGAAGLLYALGFLVVNISLLSFGVFEAGLLRERYVSAGVAFILLLTIIAGFWFFFIYSGLKRFINRHWPDKIYTFIRKRDEDLSARSDRFRDTWGLRRIYIFFENYGLAKLLTFVIVVAALILISLSATALVAFIWKISTDPMEVRTLIDQSGDVDFWSQRWRNILSARPVFFWCVLVSLIFAVWRIWTNWDKVIAIISGTDIPESQSQIIGGGGGANKSKGASPARTDLVWVLATFKRNWSYFLVIILLFFALVVYARNVFPALPAAMGGGLPIVVQFSAKEPEDLQELIQLGIPVEENKPNLTRQITLVAQTSSSYIVLVSNAELDQNVAVSIPKDHIDGIIYYPEEYFLKDEYVAELRTQEGLDLLAQGDYQKAIEKFAEAKDRKDDYLPALIGLGDAYLAQYSAEGFTCPIIVCSIDEAIKRYKDVLNQPIFSRENGEGKAPESEMAFFAEALYKLARAYALSLPTLSETILNYPCPVSGVEELYSVPPLEAAKEALCYAIEVDKEMDPPQNFAESAKFDDAFHQHGDALRIDMDFVALIFLTTADAVRGYSAEASNLQELGEIEAAVDYYKWAIEILKYQEFISEDLQQEKPDLYFNRANLYMQIHGQETRHCEEGNCLDKAISDLDEAVTLEPNNASYLTKMADALRIASRLEEAAETYMRVIGSEEFSGYAPAWLGLGETYLLRGENLSAREAFSRTITLQSGNAAAFFGRAKAEALIGEDLDMAISDLRQAIALKEAYLNEAQNEPVFISLVNILDLTSAKRIFETGQINEREGNLEEAIQYYLEAIQLDSGNDAYYAALANAYRELPTPSWEQAEQAYLQAIKLNPENDAYYAALAKAYSEFPTPRWDEAEGAYQRAIVLSEVNDNYHFSLGEVYIAQGKYEQAIESFGKAIDINENNAIYHDRLSAAFFKEGLEFEAKNEGETAVSMEPENPDYRFHLAEIYRQIGGENRAIINYEKIIELDPAYGDAYCGLAIVYYQSAGGEDAGLAYQQCQQQSDNEYLKGQAEAEKTTFELRQNGTGEGS